ncbi:hypothetical protein LOAG_13436 [Loa loa]|uniref:Uncharacterized protein n=1 Tax=Loa loa TaxID=7209 RepID=A0A1S0TJB0_LOALO|nr:hypothetical protein LOAG_13436 [Loa loa]EFO15079.1 hypothetical protein LOAG_13436 [Loa loa]
MMPQTVCCPDGKEDWIFGETHCYHLVTYISMFNSDFEEKDYIASSLVINGFN